MYDNVPSTDLLDLSVRCNGLVAHAQALLDAGQLPVDTWGFPLDCLTGLAHDVNVAVESRGLLAFVEGGDGANGGAGDDRATNEQCPACYVPQLTAEPTSKSHTHIYRCDFCGFVFTDDDKFDPMVMQAKVEAHQLSDN
jgi:hypothetical protein